MADVYEKNLTESTTIGSGDFIRKVGSDETSEKAPFDLVAKAIVEDYDDSELAGAPQSLKEAIDGLKVVTDKWNSANRTMVYGAKWDRTTNLLTRTHGAEEITTDTTNFCHKGSLNANYNNPFDSIYPWSDIQVVNVDLSLYQSGNYALKDCICAVYGDADFTYFGDSNVLVGRFIPEFWYRSSEDANGNITFLVSQCEREGFMHSPAAVDGIGPCIDAGLNSSNQNIVTAGAGIPLTNVTGTVIHTRANNSGFTLMDIFRLSAINVLYLVEYANMNSQAALGDGCSAQYRENASDTVGSVSTSGGETNITMATNDCASYCVVGAQIDIGASVGATTYRAIIKAVDTSGSTPVLTIDENTNIAAGMCVSFHGFAACEFPYIGTSLGNASGYLGTNGKANAYYRGAVFFGNRYNYILGIYRQTGTNKIWICPTTLDPDDYNALNTSVHLDTGVALPSLSAAAWATVGGNAKRIRDVHGLLITGESSGSSSSPVGDQQYVPLASAADTVLWFGGAARAGWNVGCFCGYWNIPAGSSLWYHAGCPLLKNPV